MSLANKNILVFAGSRGIGRAAAIQLGNQGATIGVGYAGNKEAANEVMEKINASAGKAFIFQADVSRRNQVDEAFENMQTNYGDIDIVINAAAFSHFEPHASVSEESLEKSIAVNVRGAFNVLQAAANQTADKGRIIQFSTGGTKMPVPGGGVYAATKAGGEHMALALSKELGHRGITVNVISPGMTNTDGLIMPQEQIDMLVGQTPLGRLGEADDVAKVVTFLASDEAAWVTGQNIHANGGIL